MKRLITGVVVCALLAVCSATCWAEQVTLTVWDQFLDETSNAVMESLVKEFEAQNPGVVVKRSVMDDDSMKTVLKTSIGSNSGPDIFYHSQGQRHMGPLVDAGLLYDLTDVFKQMNWDTRVEKWAQLYASLGGRIWSMPHEAECHGVFYHKDIFTKLGLSEPNTYVEFLEVCQTLKDNGYTPISMGSRGQKIVGHVESPYYGAFVSDQMLYEVIYEGGSWDQAPFVATISAMKELHDKGYIPAEVNALGEEEKDMLFYGKRAGMTITGSWILPKVLGELSELEVGYFVLPPVPGVERKTSKASGAGWAISAKSPNIDLAIKYLDLMISEKATDMWINQAKLFPTTPITNTESLHPLQRTVLAAIKGEYSAYNMSGTMPEEVNMATWSNIQKMWDGKMTPAQVMEEKQALWHKYTALKN